MHDTWASRDLPVLDAVVTLLDEPGRFAVSGSEIAEHTGMELADVAAALEALEDAYLDLSRTLGDTGSWHVMRVTPDARRLVGQWPTADSLLAKLVDGFNAAAEHEPDPERQSRLRAIASGLGGGFRDVAADILARVIEHKTGLG